MFILHLIGAIAHGNTVVIVPDEQFPIPCLDLYEIFDTSDMPTGVVNILTGSKQHLTKHLCEHQQVSALWYLSDLDAKGVSVAEEKEALQFIKHTSAFSMKKNWAIPNSPLMSQNMIKQVYFEEIKYNSTQSKIIHCPMGTIFAN